MAKPKRANIYREVRALAESYQNGNRNLVIDRCTRPGPSRQVLPALVYKNLLEIDESLANGFLKRVVDESVRD